MGKLYMKTFKNGTGVGIYKVGPSAADFLYDGGKRKFRIRNVGSVMTALKDVIPLPMKRTMEAPEFVNYQSPKPHDILISFHLTRDERIEIEINILEGATDTPKYVIKGMFETISKKLGEPL